MRSRIENSGNIVSLSCARVPGFRPVVSALCALLALGLAGCATPFPPNARPYHPSDATGEYDQALRLVLEARALSQARKQEQTYRIAPKDIIEIQVFESEKLNMLTRIDGNGAFGFPHLGRIRAAGLTPMELETVLQGFS